MLCSHVWSSISLYMGDCYLCDWQGHPDAPGSLPSWRQAGDLNPRPDSEQEIYVNWQHPGQRPRQKVLDCRTWRYWEFQRILIKKFRNFDDFTRDCQAQPNSTSSVDSHLPCSTLRGSTRDEICYLISSSLLPLSWTMTSLHVKSSTMTGEWVGMLILWSTLRSSLACCWHTFGAFWWRFSWYTKAFKVLTSRAQ